MPRNFEGLLCCTTICSTQLTGIFGKGIWLIYESGVVPEYSSGYGDSVIAMRGLPSHFSYLLN